VSDPLDHHRALARAYLDGRRVIVATDAVVVSAALAARVEELGAAATLVVGGSRGTGELDPDAERDAIDLGTAGDGIMGGIRAFEAGLDVPPRRLVDAIEAFDPDRAAVVLSTLFSRRAELCGRPVLGRREPTWLGFEDKTAVDRVWDAVGVRRAPSRVVPVELDAVRRAVAEVDAGVGTVWAADEREGWHGGAEGVRWVRTDDDLPDAVAELATMADRVRVMPFLDGRPCSIHGWVLGDHVAVLRPCEMVVLREPGSRRFRYAGASTTWVPSDVDGEAIRDVARRVGVHLRDTVGYRGIFTVDGVLTADGFLPTELNPRFGGAVGMLGRGAQLPLYLLHLASIDNPGWDWRPAELEAGILAAGRDATVAAAHTIVDTRVHAQRHALLVRDARGALVAVEAPPPAGEGVDGVDGQGVAGDGVVAEGVDGEPVDGGRVDGAVGTAVLGPASGGGLLRVEFADHPLGPAVAPLAAEALTVAAAWFGVPMAPLAPAPDLRPA
jgi:hypothetical protein